jgi:hypothetical protein
VRGEGGPGDHETGVGETGVGEAGVGEAGVGEWSIPSDDNKCFNACCHDDDVRRRGVRRRPLLSRNTH